MQNTTSSRNAERVEDPEEVVLLLVEQHAELEDEREAAGQRDVAEPGGQRADAHVDQPGGDEAGAEAGGREHPRRRRRGR